MRRNWRRRCLPPHWASNSIRTEAGMRKRKYIEFPNKIVRTMQITQSAIGDKRGLWTTVLAASNIAWASENNHSGQTARPRAVHPLTLRGLLPGALGTKFL